MIDNRHLLRMAVNDRTASFRQFAARWSTATGVLMSASSIPPHESRFNFWDHDGRIRVRRYASGSCLPECVTERHSGLTPRIMHVAKTVRDFCSSQHTQLFPWPAYSPDMSPIEHVWYLFDRHFARDPRRAASKD
ncbi:hypothetical protein TNCV_368601 [Trichonephila clavipes]|nr:hypothetical protein TNCV_368601 [Trichonephila clavipes]